MTGLSPFTRQYGPWALIAGGSEGIGRSFAHQLAARGLHLILIGRRTGTLEAAANDIRERFDVQVSTHAEDLTAPDLDARLEALVAAREVGLMVYNAGATHGAGLLHDTPLEEALALVRLNCVGPLTLVYQLGSRMRARGRGGIILLSSMSALAGSGYVATYAATKAFDRILAEGLWWELGAFGVDVLGLLAGATETPAMARSTIRYDRSGTAAGQAAMQKLSIVPMDPDDVAREALEHLGHGPIWIAGEKNRATAERLARTPREEAITLMSEASAKLHGLTPPKRSGG
ncbi:MAG: SDR family NAD(P)-dependent oxidoreductase [Gammaproteobacteria bacterium]|nr:SDR family NAD(P)-dependent oxidoreductase [Gammaproteobacteria bacterium]